MFVDIINQEGSPRPLGQGIENPSWKIKLHYTQNYGGHWEFSYPRTTHTAANLTEVDIEKLLLLNPNCKAATKSQGLYNILLPSEAVKTFHSNLLKNQLKKSA